MIEKIGGGRWHLFPRIREGGLPLKEEELEAGLGKLVRLAAALRGVLEPIAQPRTSALR